MEGTDKTFHQGSLTYLTLLCWYSLRITKGDSSSFNSLEYHPEGVFTAFKKPNLHGLKPHGKLACHLPK